MSKHRIQCRYSWTARRILVAVMGLLTMGIVQSFPSEVYAQRKAHYLFNARLPAGEIGQRQLMRRPELVGVSQPVLLKAPKGSSVAIAEGAGFSYSQTERALVGLQVGSTYRLKVSNIPNKFGDVFPTVEIIDRMHAPVGKEARYPIPVELTADDLGHALAGRFVTRVVYVEDPRRALAARDLPEQRYFDAMGHEDPLLVANGLGRPVAILRIGSLAPGRNGPSSEFLFGSPPVQRLATPASRPYIPSTRPANKAAPEYAKRRQSTFRRSYKGR